MSGDKMNRSFSGAMSSTFELLHEENYFSDKKNEIYKVTSGVSKVFLNIFLILHMIITRPNDKGRKMPVSLRRNKGSADRHELKAI